MPTFFSTFFWQTLFILFASVLLVHSTVLAEEPFDYEKQVGLLEYDRQIKTECVIIANPNLKPGTRLTAIGRNLFNPSKPASVITGKISKKMKNCASGGGAKNVAYGFTYDEDRNTSYSYDFVVDLPPNRFKTKGNKREIDLNGDGILDRFRACFSSESIHLEVWNGDSVNGSVMWKNYKYLGYDLAPSPCWEANFSR